MVILEKQNFEENKKIFESIKNDLAKTFLDCPINHVGSTAIPNMYGKNIIDILIGVKSQIELVNTTSKLESLGYFKGNHCTNEYSFLASSNEETKSGDIHIHVGIIGTDRYEDFIRLRNYLLNNPKEAKEYSNYKFKIIKKSSDRSEYRTLKASYVDELIKRARN